MRENMFCPYKHHDKTTGIKISRFCFTRLNSSIVSYYEPNLLKNSFGKEVFQIFAKIEVPRSKIRQFGRHFEAVFF